MTRIWHKSSILNNYFAKNEFRKCSRKQIVNTPKFIILCDSKSSSTQHLSILRTFAYERRNGLDGFHSKKKLYVFSQPDFIHRRLYSIKSETGKETSNINKMTNSFEKETLSGNDDTMEDKKKKKKGMDRELMKQVGILTGSQLALNLGFSQIIPVMPLFCAQMGGHLGATGIGLVVSAPSLTRLLCNVPLGRLADTIGRKPLMWGGTMITATGTILTGFSYNLLTLIPCRLMVGMGTGSSMTGSSAYLADLSDRAPEHRATIMGINNMLVGSVWIIGPAMGGMLAEMYGFRNSFIIAGAGAALCSLGYTQLPETLKVSQKKAKPFNFKSWMSDTKEILSSPNQQALIAQSCVQPLRFASFTTVLALHASNVANIGPKELGMMFTAMAFSQAIGMPIGAYLTNKAKEGPRKSILLPHSILNAATYGSLAFATSETHFIVGMGLLGLLNSFSNPVIGAFTAESTEPHKRGQAMSLMRTAGDAITLIGPISFGLLADFHSCELSLLVTSGMMLGCSSIYLLRAKPIIKP